MGKGEDLKKRMFIYVKPVTNIYEKREYQSEVKLFL